MGNPSPEFFFLPQRVVIIGILRPMHELRLGCVPFCRVRVGRGCGLLDVTRHAADVFHDIIFI